MIGRAIVGMENGIGAPCPLLDEALGCATIFGAAATMARLYFKRRRITISAAAPKAIGDSMQSE